MENALEKMLNVSVKKLNEFISRDQINSGAIFITGDKQMLFVKTNTKYGADIMFNGELEGLKAIEATKTVRVPKPIATGFIPEKDLHFIVMEYFELDPLSADTSVELGKRVAKMHLQNLKKKKSSIKQFGFHVQTSCGFIPQNNTWTDDWITFFTENRLAYQIELLKSNLVNRYSSKPMKQKVIEDYWPRLKQIIPKFFQGIDVEPSLLHGDLWSGNAGRIKDSSAVIYDPAAFYGHHEYDIASTLLFGGYSGRFFDAYFSKIPKAKGFEDRMKLYQLFHYLNHWNHFGDGYLKLSMNTFEELLGIKR